MSNPAIRCNVNECVHHCECNQCTLPSIEVSHDRHSQDAMQTPHYCSSYCKK